MLIDRATLENVDKNRLERLYSKWPVFFNDALKLTCNLDHDPDFYESVVLCGMGGSGSSSDIINDIMKKFGSVPSTVVQGHKVPAFVGKHSLVIVNSVSGNTDEAISIMEEASQKNAEVVCISSGGTLIERSEKYSNKNIVIPNLGVSRALLPYLVVPGLRLIDPLLNESIEKYVLSIATNLSNIYRTVSTEDPELSNSAKLAAFLCDSMVFCFISPSITSVGLRFKNSLNENAKVNCIANSILEASHNEIVPFSFRRNYTSSRVLLINWGTDDTLVKERFEKVKRFFTEIGQQFMEIDGYYNDIVNAIISSIYILDISTIYMAAMRNIDPSSTPAIDLIKGYQKVL